MKVLNHIKLLLVLTVAILSFSSCEQDDESIYYYIVDRTWVGDLGFAVGPYNVESGITFKGNDYASMSSIIMPMVVEEERLLYLFAGG